MGNQFLFDLIGSGPSQSMRTQRQIGLYAKTSFEKTLVANITTNYGTLNVIIISNNMTPGNLYVVNFINKYNQADIQIYGLYAKLFLNNLGSSYRYSIRKIYHTDDQTSNFPISKVRVLPFNSNGLMAQFSKYAIINPSKSFSNYSIIHYKYLLTKNESQSWTGQNKHLNFPKRKNSLIAYTNEYIFNKPNINFNTPPANFTNWRDWIHLLNKWSDYDKEIFSKSITFRRPGRPNQIMLHETSNFKDLNVKGIGYELAKDENRKPTNRKTHFFIPHFCINNIEKKTNYGQIVQFVDIASNVSHAGWSNNRSIGIEFSNNPFHSDGEGNPLPISNLFNTQGIFLQTNKLYQSDLAKVLRPSSNRSFFGKKLFIPLEFNKKPSKDTFDLEIPNLNNGKSSAANLPLIETYFKDYQPIVEKKGGKTILKNVSARKFNHLAALLHTLVINNLVEGITSLSDKSIWKMVIDHNGSEYFVFRSGVLEKGNSCEYHFYFDMRKPGILNHILIGSHFDGGIQSLYLYLRFVKKMAKDVDIFNYILNTLTQPRNKIEKKGITLPSKCFIKYRYHKTENGYICKGSSDDNFEDAQSPIKIYLRNIIEL